MRYKIYEGSASGHCCFEYTILDTQVYESIAGRPDDQVGYFKSLCETFDENSAIQICLSLNGGDGCERVTDYKEQPVDLNKKVLEE